MADTRQCKVCQCRHGAFVRQDVCADCAGAEIDRLSQDNAAQECLLHECEVGAAQFQEEYMELEAERDRLKEIVNACHHAIGEDEASDDDTLAEGIAGLAERVKKLEEVIVYNKYPEPTLGQKRIAELVERVRELEPWVKIASNYEKTFHADKSRIVELGVERDRLIDMGREQDKCLQDWMEDDAERDTEEDIKDKRIAELETALKHTLGNCQPCGRLSPELFKRIDQRCDQCRKILALLSVS